MLLDEIKQALEDETSVLIRKYGLATYTTLLPFIDDFATKTDEKEIKSVVRSLEVVLGTEFKFDIKKKAYVLQVEQPKDIFPYSGGLIFFQLEIPTSFYMLPHGHIYVFAGSTLLRDIVVQKEVFTALLDYLQHRRSRENTKQTTRYKGPVPRRGWYP